MAHILCATHGLSGLLYSSFELARRLEDAGHRVTYLTRLDAAAVVEAQGFAYYAFDRDTPPRPPSSPGRLQQLRTIRARRERAAQALGGDAFAQALRTLEPDLLLIDIELHPFILTAVPMGVPTVLLSPFFSLWKRPGVPPLHKPLMPGNGGHGQRGRIEWAWWRYRAGKALARLRTWTRTVGVDPTSVLQHYARQTGFPFAAETMRFQWLIPVTYRTLPVLCLNARELEFPHVPHSSVHYVGPMIHLARRDVGVDPEQQARLRQLLHRERNGEPARPLIVVSCSTFATASASFLARIVDVARLRPAWDVLLSLGGLGRTDDLSPLPPNVHAFAWIPVLEVLPHAAAMVTNAGINTINECIHFGVPTVVFSLRKNDQNGTAARVAYHGVGVVGDLARDDAETIAAHLGRALADEQLRQNIERMQQHFAAYRTERRSVAIIEALLDHS